MDAEDIQVTNGPLLRIVLGISTVVAVAGMAMALQTWRGHAAATTSGPPLPLPPAPTRNGGPPPDISPPVAMSTRRATIGRADEPDAVAPDGLPTTERALLGERVVAVSYRPRPTVVLLGGDHFRTGDRLPSGAVLGKVRDGVVAVFVDDTELVLTLAPHHGRGVVEIR